MNEAVLCFIAVMAWVQMGCLVVLVVLALRLRRSLARFVANVEGHEERVEMPTPPPEVEGDDPVPESPLVLDPQLRRDLAADPAFVPPPTGSARSRLRPR